MRKQIILLIAVLMSIAAMAQRRKATAEDWHYFQQKGCTLKLENYGLYQNGTEQNKIYPQGKNLNEYCILKTNTMVHKNTLDGDYIYDFKIDGQYLRLSNRAHLKDEGGMKGFDPDYDNWIRLVWVEQKGDKTILFTYDKYGTYRYFTTTNPGQELPNSFCGIYLDESYNQVIESLKAQKIKYEITEDNFIQCSWGTFTFNHITFNNLCIYFDNNNKVKGIMLGYACLENIFSDLLDTSEDVYTKLETLANQNYSKYFDPELAKDISKDYPNNTTIKAYSDSNANIALYIIKDWEFDENLGLTAGFAEVVIKRL